MGQYRYVALTHDGRRARGLIEAVDEAAAVRALAARGETAVHLASGQSRWLPEDIASARPRRGELAAFLADLAALHRAGVPLRRALDVLAEEAGSKSAARLAKLMGERLDAGADIRQAASVASDADIALVAELARAGEASGRLGETLSFGATLLERQDAFARKLRSALAYPLFLLGLAVFAIIAIAAFAGPALAPILEEAENDTAGVLRAVIAFGDLLRTHGLLILLGVIGLMFALAALARAPAVAEMLARARLTAPVIGSIVRDLSYGAFARTLGALLSGGAPAAVSVDLAASTAPNSAARRRLREVGTELREGRTIAACMARLPGAPAELKRLARVGEEAGALGEMIARAGDISVERAIRRLDQVATAAGPILIIVLGGGIGWLMSAFLTGLASLGDVTL